MFLGSFHRITTFFSNQKILMSDYYFASWRIPRLAACVFTCLVSMLSSLPTTAQVSFRPPVNYSSASRGPYRAAVGDINRDGKSDVVVVNYLSNSISVLLGNGLGAFSNAVTYSTGVSTKPFTIALADVNNDGILDAVTTNDSRTNSVLLGTYAGGFAAARQYSSGNNDQIDHTALGDVNRDGNLDMVVSVFGTGTIQVFLNNGRGEFPSAPASYTTGTGTTPQGLALGDFNGDNSLDMAVASPSGFSYEGGVTILLNNGSGIFSAPIFYSVSTTVADVEEIICDDLNGDGRLDIVASNPFRGTVSILIGRGNGSFMPAVDYSSRESSNDISNIGLGDMNGDGKKDIVVINQVRSILGILLNNGNGIFRLIANTYAMPMADQEPYSGVVADLNADGRPDVITVNYDVDNLTVFLNSTSSPLAVDTAPNAVAFNPYPNPAHGHVTLELPLVAGAAQGSMKLCDALGRVVLYKTIPLGKTNDVDLREVKSGIYMLSVQIGESVVVRKLVVD